MKTKNYQNADFIIYQYKKNQTQQNTLLETVANNWEITSQKAGIRSRNIKKKNKLKLLEKQHRQFFLQSAEGLIIYV